MGLRPASEGQGCALPEADAWRAGSNPAPTTNQRAQVSDPQPRFPSLRWLRLQRAAYGLFRAYENGRIEAALKTLGFLKPYCYSWRRRRAMAAARPMLESVAMDCGLDATDSRGYISGICE